MRAAGAAGPSARSTGPAGRASSRICSASSATLCARKNSGVSGRCRLPRPGPWRRSRKIRGHAAMPVRIGPGAAHAIDPARLVEPQQGANAARTDPFPARRASWTSRDRLEARGRLRRGRNGQASQFLRRLARGGWLSVFWGSWRIVVNAECRCRVGQASLSECRPTIFAFPQGWWACGRYAIWSRPTSFQFTRHRPL